MEWSVDKYLSWSVFFLPALAALLLLAPSLVVGGPPTQTACAVTGTSASCLAANGGRSYLSLQNLSDTVIYCSTDGTAASITHGYLLGANGGWAWWDVEPTVPKTAILCMTSGAGSKTLMLTEQTQ
jgi:hypothetical protein